MLQRRSGTKGRRCYNAGACAALVQRRGFPGSSTGRGGRPLAVTAIFFLSARLRAAFDETGYEMWRRPLLSFLLVSVFAQPALADRPFPQNAKRGKMTPAPYPDIVVEGQMRQLAPGARIWNENNLIEMPASLRGSDLTVNYTEDGQGNIDRVWILSTEEAREPITQQTNSKSR
jgi:hypothetical protein